MAKITRKPFKSVKRNSELLNLILTDICIFEYILKWGENIYFIIFNDDFSKYAYVSLGKIKVKHLKIFPPLWMKSKTVSKEKSKDLKLRGDGRMTLFFRHSILRVEIKSWKIHF